ncbi:RNA-directed DNA polymerase (reverse transcriptase)-related family protein [Rhynchospora pubera]|uniref:RNA-directed DNA polymerase (Reverse transcriptase)-related family protein n=1 Tax=Rhynchospora pubera TaxID=906938 RepID=A0AAV8FRH9_9POAL|nr:RNA-directed DNA polymerase (reverse transcriptase)-related family protein [Rhynchospora pubera]
MGPDKAPSPDGITCRFLQMFWVDIGPGLVAQIQHVFQSERVPQKWLDCSVVLIPKKEEPETPAEFRPISIGTVLYRLVMKIIANRLRPFLKNVISDEQTAFMKGRHIADNILLVKEILHSFGSKNYKQEAFLLKADITKAFDMLNWEFLTCAMRYLGMPEKIISLMITSFQRARVTIKINGKGDGFIAPNRGLRQGCPMSPYGFIIAMELLSRCLNMAHTRGKIIGTKLAHTSPVVTHIIYADDLVLTGLTYERELNEFNRILQVFGVASGLSVNPAKSKIWFSKYCRHESIDRVTTILQASTACDGERYLGALLAQKNSPRKMGLILLDRMKAKMAGWKTNMLSHAGRLVLIKSVLASLPVYFMSFEVIPKGIIKQMNSLLAKFFWGKVGQDRYMTFISWKKICTPIDRGGLAVKDLQCFGEALFQKLLWFLMSDDKRLWVQICKAKYYPRIGFWKSKCNSSASHMWKQVDRIKHKFKEEVFWNIGNGQTALAISQPWFRGWEGENNVTSSDRKKKVAQLFDFEINQWRMEELQRLFTMQQIATITIEVAKPTREVMISDKLIWKHTTSGSYTVKEGYRRLAESAPRTGNVDGDMWKKIWGWKQVAPKVRIFLWRLLSKALPVAQNMHTRINRFSPLCQRCGHENEYEVHCFFFCQGSRAVWFGSSLGFQVQHLPLEIGEAVKYICSNLDDEHLKVFSYTLWEIWKRRNEVVLHRKDFQPRKILEKVKGWLRPIENAAHNAIQQRQENIEGRHEFQRGGWQVIVDGSWDVSQAAGTAHLIYKDGILVAIGVQHHNFHDPFLAEAVALQQAMLHFKGLGVTQDEQVVQFFTDCANLVSALNENDLHNLPSWRAMRVVREIITVLEEMGQRASVIHVTRKGVVGAHNLANQTRRVPTNYMGVPIFDRWPDLQLNKVLDTEYFQQVQEAPP